ncbi:MAG: flagellar protein FlaG [Pseudomonadota bacterium]
MERIEDRPPPSSDPDADLSPETLQKVIGVNARLSIEAHEKSGDYVYKSIDRNTGEVINQWPPEKFLRFLEAELERLDLVGERVGVVADERA